jgi:hypothetical protein
MHGVATDAIVPDALAAVLGVSQPVKAAVTPTAEKTASQEMIFLCI